MVVEAVGIGQPGLIDGPAGGGGVGGVEVEVYQGMGGVDDGRGEVEGLDDPAELIRQRIEDFSATDLKAAAHRRLDQPSAIADLHALKFYSAVAAASSRPARSRAAAAARLWSESGSAGRVWLGLVAWYASSPSPVMPATMVPASRAAASAPRW